MTVRIIVVFVITCVVQSVIVAESVPPVPETAYEKVDDFSYSRRTAAKVWKPMAGSKPVSLVEIDGKKALRMRCNFHGTKIERASWDRSLKLDLAMCSGLQFFFYCRDTSPVAGFGIYLHSGDGWYKGQFDAPVSDEWTAIKVHKDAMDVEGRPAGWGKVDTIRISAWRGQDVDTEFYISAMGLFGTAGKIGVVRCDSAASQAPNELRAIKKYTNVMTEFLGRAGLSHIVLSDLDVTLTS